MTDMMLTGRVLDAQEGHSAGSLHSTVGAVQGMAANMEQAEHIASNAAMSNYGVMHLLPRIADQSMHDGMVTESLMAAVAQTDPATLDLLAQFLEGKKNKVKFKPQ